MSIELVKNSKTVIKNTKTNPTLDGVHHDLSGAEGSYTDAGQILVSQRRKHGKIHLVG
jgi:hypothetical protein